MDVRRFEEEDEGGRVPDLLRQLQCELGQAVHHCLHGGGGGGGGKGESVTGKTNQHSVYITVVYMTYYIHPTQAIIIVSEALYIWTNTNHITLL